MILRQIKLLACWVAALLMTSCDFTPDLHLGHRQVMVELPLVVTDMEVVWQLDAQWDATWIYGWDEVDESNWGKLEYPQPTSFEIRRYYMGLEPGGMHQTCDAFTVYENSFMRQYDFGYYISSPQSRQEGVHVLLSESA